MKKKDDWRLQGQEEYLKGKTLYFEKYNSPREGWDHDHCEFCFTKFAEYESAETLTEGYTTQDHYRWICEKCFNDFKDIFNWKLGNH